MERKNLSVTFHARTYNIINPRLKNNSTSFINFTSPLAQYISINIHNYIHSPPKTYCQVIDSNSKACIFERTSPFRARVSPFLYSAMWIPLKKKKKRKKCAPLATEKWTFHGIAQWLWDISSEQPWNETLIIPHLHRKFSPTLSNQAGLSLACKTCISS